MVKSIGQIPPMPQWFKDGLNARPKGMTQPLMPKGPPCRVPDATEDASLLDTSSNSPTRGPEDWKIPLDRLDLIGQRTAAMELHLIEIRGMLQTIIQALAEDQDPDEMPAQYLDGSPVR